MGYPWVKLWLDILDDVKLGRLEERLQLLYIKLILLAGECDAGGGLIVGSNPMTLEDIAWRLRLSPGSHAGVTSDSRVTHADVTKQLESDINRMCKPDLKLLVMDRGVITVTKFSERQGPAQAEKREKWRARQNRRREQVKDNEGTTTLTEGKADVTPVSPGSHAGVTRDSRVTHASVTLKESESEEDKEQDKEEEPPAAGWLKDWDYLYSTLMDDAAPQVRAIILATKPHSVVEINGGRLIRSTAPIDTIEFLNSRVKPKADKLLPHTKVEWING